MIPGRLGRWDNARLREAERYDLRRLAGFMFGQWHTSYRSTQGITLAYIMSRFWRNREAISNLHRILQFALERDLPPRVCTASGPNRRVQWRSILRCVNGNKTPQFSVHRACMRRPQNFQHVLPQTRLSHGFRVRLLIIDTRDNVSTWVRGRKSTIRFGNDWHDKRP